MLSDVRINSVFLSENFREDQLTEAMLHFGDSSSESSTASAAPTAVEMGSV